MALRLIHIITCIAACSHPAFLRGQQLFLDADTTTIDLGAQTHLTIRFEQRTLETPDLQWPEIGDTLTNGFELLEAHSIDTLRDNDLLQLTQRIKITRFDTGFAVIEPFTAKLGGRTLASNPLLIEVRAPELSTDTEIKDIKDIRRTRYTLWHKLLLWLRHYWYIPVAVISVAMAFFIYFRLKRRDADTVTNVPEVIDDRPAHVIALEALELLETKKLWETGKTKAYYIELTDILRHYIERRWEVPALEQTTRELESALRAIAIQDSLREDLLQTLRLADAVKFARYTGMAPENEQSFKNAKRFVESTAQRETTTA